MISFSYSPRSMFLIYLNFLSIFEGASSAKFTMVNKCDYTVWPGILGTPELDTTGFELAKGSSRSFLAPTGWSGRFWGRTGCRFDASGHGSCSTADCGSSQVECNGNSANPPATLAEFTLGSASQQSKDFYDVSLVDGYNLPMLVEVTDGGSAGECSSTGCLTDINRKCPAELRVEDGAACRSACDAFGNKEYCCSGAYNSPSACKPSIYSEMFKSACPKSYSYAFDDASSTFTCIGADYTITFCPNSSSIKSATDSHPKSTTYQKGQGPEEGEGNAVATNSNSGEEQEAALANAWLESLATGDSTTTHQPLSLAYHLALLFATFPFLYHTHK